MFFTLPGPHWNELFGHPKTTELLGAISTWLAQEYETHRCTPPQQSIFNAFQYCPEDQLKVIILGQDPYPAPGVADGMAFSTQKKGLIPASLKNILIESGNPRVKTGDLRPWAKQGVLLLNTVLSTQVNQPNAHQNRGWELFTTHALNYVISKNIPLVVMLWGNAAKKFSKPLIGFDHLLVLESGHPSPLSANRGLWFGNNHFNQANKYLEHQGQTTINWTLTSDTLYSEPTLF